jgi:hypothetical protein
MDIKLDTDDFETREVFRPSDKTLAGYMVKHGWATSIFEAQFFILSVVAIILLFSVYLMFSGGPELNPNPNDVPQVAGPATES